LLGPSVSCNIQECICYAIWTNEVAAIPR
jgi:hypothetical protein